MKTARIIMYVVFVYLFLMIVVSFSSDVISVISDGAETAHVETKSDEITTVNETQYEAQNETQYETPFDFSVNVNTITEAEEETAEIYPIHRMIPDDSTSTMIDELKKRKKYFICSCKRKRHRHRCLFIYHRGGCKNTIPKTICNIVKA